MLELLGRRGFRLELAGAPRLLAACAVNDAATVRALADGEALAVRACVDSHWTHLRAPESVRTLLAAGASVEDVAYPSGYAEVDALLAAAGAKERAERPPNPR